MRHGVSFFACSDDKMFRLIDLRDPCVRSEFFVSSRLPMNQRRGYKNVIDALIQIARQEGVLNLWRVCAS